MAEKFRLGAIDVETKKYILPFEATKGRKYECIDCKKAVVLRKGPIRVHHFAHYAQTNTCNYYDHPNEAQIHKDAKLLMQKLLNDKRLLCFTWDCDNCGGFYAFEEVPTIKYIEGDEAILEYRDKDGKWIADVALVNNGNVRYIIEIKNKHQTTTQRPEPWFEVDASEFIKKINELYEDSKRESEELGFVNEANFIFRIPCIRKDIERKCYGCFCYKESWVRKIPGFHKEKEKDNSCILCKKTDYFPSSDGCTGKFQYGKIRVCTDCLAIDIYEKKIRNLYANESKNKNSTLYYSENRLSLGEIKLLNYISTLWRRVGAAEAWKQELKCSACGCSKYSPVYYNKSYYAICILCLGNKDTQQIILDKISDGKLSSNKECLIFDD